MTYKALFLFLILVFAKLSLAEPVIIACDISCNDINEFAEQVAKNMHEQSGTTHSEFAIFSPEKYAVTSFKVDVTKNVYGEELPQAKPSSTPPDVGDSIRLINQIVERHGVLTVHVDSIADVSKVVEVHSRLDLERSSQARDFLALHLEASPDVERALGYLRSEIAEHVSGLYTVYMRVIAVLADGSEWPFVATSTNIGELNKIRVLELKETPKEI